MENESTEKALSSLETKLKKFFEKSPVRPDDAKNTGEEQNNEKTNETASSNIGKQHEGDNIDSTVKDSSDVEKNPKESVNQFNVVNPGIESGGEAQAVHGDHQKGPSAEEIAKTWQDLGVKRCPNCKFTTDNEELFRNHCTSCPAVKTTGIIKLTFKNGEFSCNVCDDTWTNKAEFEEHIVCHLQDSPYVCLTCQNKRFASRQQIEIHTKFEHPYGNARCGLKGMKNGRKCTEELIQTGTTSIQGKLSIPKTPKNLIRTKDKTTVVPSGQTFDSGKSSTSLVVTSSSSHIAEKPVVVNTSLLDSVSAVQPNVSTVVSSALTSGYTIHYKPEELNFNNPAEITIGTLAPVSSMTISASKMTYSDIVALTSSTTVATSSLQVSSQSESLSNNQKPGSVSHSNNDTEFDNSRPMPPARVTLTLPTSQNETHLYTSKGGTLIRISPSEEAKSKHLDSLFGELNRTTNSVQPTTVSQRIKEIANPAHNKTKTENVTKSIPYSLKTITEYTCTPSIKTVTPSVSTIPPQNLIIVPVGQPIMQSPVPLPMQNTGILYQSQSHGPVLLPLQPVKQTTQVTGSGASMKGQLTTLVTSIPQNLQGFSRMPVTAVVFSSGGQKININTRSNISVASNKQPVGGITSSYSASNLFPIIQPRPLSLCSAPVAAQNDGSCTIAEKKQMIPQATVSESSKVGPVLKLKFGESGSAEYAKVGTALKIHEAAVTDKSKAPTSVKIQDAVIDERTKVATDTEVGEGGQQIPKKYLFKIKPGQGFVCEACKKFTKDEYVFRRHVWEHFHGDPLACRTCPVNFISHKIVLECKLVNNIVCNLIKRSASERQEDTSKSLKVEKFGETEVIDITDDDNEKSESKHKDKQNNATEVIVLDDEEDENAAGHGLKIQISSTYSLSDPQNLENMSNQDIHQSGNKIRTGNTEKENGEMSAINKTSIISSSETVAQENNALKDLIQEVEHAENDTHKDEGQSEINMPLSDEGHLICEEKSSKVPKEAKSSELNCGQVYPKKDAVQMEITEAGDTVTYSTKVLEENLDKEDRVFERNLLDKSLSEPEKDSEEVVSQVVEKNLKDYDPSNKADEKTTGEDIAIDLESVGSKNKGLLQNSMKRSQENVSEGLDIDHSNLQSKNAFFTEVLSKQSHNAFYVCGFENCSFTCLSSSKYRDHLKSKGHENEYNFICGHCGQKDYTEDTHVRHLFTHANSKTFLLYKCPIRLCKYRTNLLHLYAEHLRAHSAEELTVKCVYCHKTFPTIESLVQHLKQHLLKFVICPHCSFKFANRYVVMMHMKHAHPDKVRLLSVTSQIVCNEREINFYNLPKSKASFLSGISSKDIQAADSLDIPALLNNFQKENVEYTRIQESNTKEIGAASCETDDILSLPEEDQSDFKERKNRLDGDRESQVETSLNRQNKAKGKSENDSTVDPKSLECPKCSYLSYNRSLHASHLALHDTEPQRGKRFVCSLCPKGTDNLFNFKSHIRNHVGKHVIKVFVCTSCSYNSNQKCHIMDHVRDAHSEPSLYTLKEETVESNHSECRYCAFKAKTDEQVVSHEIAVHHVNIKVALGKNVSREEEQEGQKTDNLQKPGLLESDTDASEKSKRKKKYKYHCEYCNDFFKHKLNLKEHMVNDHKDTENKQFIFFKCKYCVYTSTMKDMIIGHLEEEHPGMELRILRKIEMIESVQLEAHPSSSTVVEKDVESVKEERDRDSNALGDKLEEVVIPDGNVFKHLFSCPKCNFSSNMRIKTMKHLKVHPELKPVRSDQQRQPSKKTARKSSSSNFQKTDASKKTSSLFQQVPVSSEPLQNPFIAVKESVQTQNISGVDTKTGESSSSFDPYILGEQKLHAALSACFIPLEKDMKYQCRICKQKIFKKFVLHRHILDHLKIVFFKCKYCEEGSIERTLMSGHIQKEHSSKTVSYDSVEKSVLEQQFKERIFEQDFNDTVDLFANSKTQDCSEIKNSRIIKKPVNEFQTVDESSEEENVTEVQVKQEIKNTEESSNIKSLKCPKCRYIARYRYYLSLHLDSHLDPMKVFTCSVCDYRGDKFSVIKHVYRVCHLNPAQVLKDGQPLYENQNGENLKVSSQSDKSKDDSKIENKKCDIEQKMESDNSVTSQDEKQVTVVPSTSTESHVYEIRTVFKCKDCGEKRDSRSSMYDHFKSSKCNKPVMKCSLCSFQNTVKAAIHRHAVKRHHGKKVSIVKLPLAAKFRIVKFPVRQPKRIQRDMNEEKVEEESKAVSNTDQATEEVSSKEQSDLLDSGQIRCQICASYICDSVMKLQFHMNTAHQGGILYCHKCSYKTPLVKHMINHCKNLHYQKVPLYGSKPTTKDIKTEETINEHQDKESKTVLGIDDRIIFKCPKCNTLLGSHQSVLSHLYVHFNYRPHSCKYCGTRMARKGHMRLHIERRHEGKPIKFDTNINDVIEAKVKKIYDSVKKSVAKQKMMLGKSRPSYLDRLELIEEGMRRKGKIYYCDYCCYKADRRLAIRRHVGSVHAGISKKRPLEIDSDTESSASKVLKQEQDENWKEEGSTVSSDKEDQNDAECKDDASLFKYKVVKTQTGTKKYKCTDCEYMNEKIKNLKLHVSRNHGSPSHGKKKALFRCCYCQYKSIYKGSDVYKHVKHQHPSMELKYINKSGEIVTHDKSTKKNVNKDRRTSPATSASSFSPARSVTESVTSDLSPIKPVKGKTGETNYNCHICGYSRRGFFQFRLHLIAHQQFTQITSELDEESRMSCGFCTYVARHTFDLSSHIASHMGEMRFGCGYCDYTQYERFKVSQHIKHCHIDREDLVIDRELRKICSGAIKLVNFSPSVELGNVKHKTKKRSYKRIMIETDDSSDGTSSEDERSGLSHAKYSGKKNNRTENTAVVHESMNDSRMYSGNGKSLTEHTKMEVEDEGSVFQSKLVQSDGNKRESQSQESLLSDTESEINTFNETQMFRVESQPFSPSDLLGSDENDLSEQPVEPLFHQFEENIEDQSAKNKDSRDGEEGESVELNEKQTGRESLTQPPVLENELCEPTQSKSGENDKSPVFGNKPPELENELPEPTQNNSGENEKCQRLENRLQDVENEIKLKTFDNSSKNMQDQTSISQSLNLENGNEEVVVDVLSDCAFSETKIIKKPESKSYTYDKTVDKSAKDELKETSCQIFEENDCKDSVSGEKRAGENTNHVKPSSAETEPSKVIEESDRIETSDSSDDSIKRNLELQEACEKDILLENDNRKNVNLTDNVDVCSSTHFDVQNDSCSVNIEGSKSPRNVFESLTGERKYSEQNNPESTISPRFAGEDMKNSGNDDVNVFEKFIPGIELAKTNDEDDCSQDNIFEKLTNESISNTGNDSKIDTLMEEKVNKNIFEKFGGVDGDRMTEDSSDERNTDETDTKISKLSGSSISSQNEQECTKDDSEKEERESNIFTKFSSENIELGRPVEEEENEDKQTTDFDNSNIFEKITDNTLENDEKDTNCGEANDNNKNLFEKFAVESPKSIQDMEVDELIRSIEQTVSEGATDQTAIMESENV